jgi:hypothetical protein
MIFSKTLKTISPALFALATLVAPVAAQTALNTNAANARRARACHAREARDAGDRFARAESVRPRAECGCDAGPLPDVLATSATCASLGPTSRPK